MTWVLGVRLLRTLGMTSGTDPRGMAPVARETDVEVEGSTHAVCVCVHHD